MGFEQSRSLLPSRFRQALAGFEKAEEIRLRCGYPPSVVMGGSEHIVSTEPVEERDILYVLELSTGASLHAVSDSLNSGYISCGGLRIGVCGQAICKEGQMLGFRNYRSLAIRIPHQCRGVIPEKLCDVIYRELPNTLIAAPPGLGKTTALRELVRSLSEKGVRVSLADERNEFSVSGFELGRCTDIISGAPKAGAAIMLLRAANPQVIAMDEITKPEDTEAILHLAGCGVSVLATAHGKDLESMLRRPLYRKLLSEGIFERLLTISMENGERVYRLERIEL